ncbi:c-type cytochrome [Algibacter mikhailovii]|uniref:Cytochrome c domain-containing protein n=1 Tax=Algibacter mikhailovii TaxID=425498 RepID=A0A918QXS2_9FLAO|nr:cytochrome c [Algibacter mikhailovii]GGZ78449.1 hypothetical protein GCM10007028_14850 [Algibacter mikhailovii]
MKVIPILVLILISNLIDHSNYTQTTPLKESISRGSVIYEDFCMQCHSPDGKGVEHVFPPLANSDFLLQNRVLSIKGIKYGQKGEISVNGKTYNGFMQPMGLDNEEIADVMNYINNSWGNKSENMVTEEEVAAIKK